MQALGRRSAELTALPTGLHLWVLVAPLVFAVSVSFAHELFAWLGAFGGDELPHWVYITAVVACDVGHVGTTLLLAHAAFASTWRAAHWAGIAAVWAAVYLICLCDLTAMWVLLGYASILHYVQQQLRLGHYLGATGFQRAMTVIGAVCPIVIWHTDEHRGFDWFFRDDPLPIVLPEVCVPLATLLWVGSGLAFVAKGCVSREGLFCMANVAVACAWVSWGVGVLYPSHSAALLFLTIPHAIPCYAVSFCTLRGNSRRGLLSERSDFERFTDLLSSNPVAYIAFLVTLAVFEEVLWDALIYREWSTHYFPHHESSAETYTFFTSVLVMPQVLHILFDLVLWDASTNPAVRRPPAVDPSDDAV